MAPVVGELKAVVHQREGRVLPGHGLVGECDVHVIPATEHTAVASQGEKAPRLAGLEAVSALVSLTSDFKMI